jgi:hypothetical protein
MRIPEPCPEEEHNIQYSLKMGWFCPHCLSLLKMAEWYQPTEFTLTTLTKGIIRRESTTP